MLKVSPLFSDGAVLCRKKEIRLFGEAEEGAKIRAELRDAKGALLSWGTGEAVDGRFLILLPPQEAQVGCTLLFTDGEETFRAKDILIGEVFLAGGQSNMEWELQNADEGPELIASHDNAQVRYFNVPKFARFCSERDRAWEAAAWRAIAPGTGRDMSAVAYFFAMQLQRKLQVPVGIIDSYWGGTSITCWMEEAWLSRTGEGIRYLEEYARKAEGVTMEAFLEKDKAFHEEMQNWNDAVAAYKQAHPGCAWPEVEEAVGPSPWHPPVGPGDPFRPAGLYETMIAPLVPLALTGALFYQGETDATRVEDCRYDTLMMSLIDRWRDAFQEKELPFLFVQLPMWIESGKQDSKTWPALRLAQSRVRDRMRNVAMACLLDQGEFGNLHPTRKRVVGERLYELALQLMYGEAGKASPRVTGKRVEDQRLLLLTDQRLVVRDGKEPALLEVAGADRKYVPASASLAGGGLAVCAPGVEYPLYARYAWTDYAVVNLFGTNGLPLEPFEV
ncbi:MAG: hypothetical protein IJ865_04010 [Clostridia bacterium]|nr:hypothetical protein [Clostridia bacterium]